MIRPRNECKRLPVNGINSHSQTQNSLFKLLRQNPFSSFIKNYCLILILFFLVILVPFHLPSHREQHVLMFPSPFSIISSSSFLPSVSHGSPCSPPPICSPFPTLIILSSSVFSTSPSYHTSFFVYTSLTYSSVR